MTTDGADNPFAAPRATLGQGVGPSGDPSHRGLVRHVLPVAILMIVQGAIELLFAVLMLAAAVMVPMMMTDDFGNAEGQPVPIKWVMLGTYGIMGLGGLLAGVLHVVGGIFGLRFRRRKFGVVALAAGMAGIFTCYCGPTAIALGIYGLVTYLNPSVIAAFALGDAGVPAADIRARFGV